MINSSMKILTHQLPEEQTES